MDLVGVEGWEGDSPRILHQQRSAVEGDLHGHRVVTCQGVPGEVGDRALPFPIVVEDDSGLGRPPRHVDPLLGPAQLVAVDSQGDRLEEMGLELEAKVAGHQPGLTLQHADSLSIETDLDPGYLVGHQHLDRMDTDDQCQDEGGEGDHAWAS